jgi:hypothetical protein
MYKTTNLLICIIFILGLTGNALGQELLVGWHTFEAKPDNTPDDVLTGISGIIDGGDIVDTGSQSTDGFYGGTGLAANSSTDSTLKVKGVAPPVTVQITNNTGNPISLGTFHADYSLWFVNGPKDITLYYDSGDLTASDNTLINSVANLEVVGKIGDYDDFDWDLSVLNDVTLADGESATFRIEGTNYAKENTAGALDNIAITGPGISGQAGRASPSNEVADVPQDDIVLSWKPGGFEGTHDVYFGTLYDEVNDASRGNLIEAQMAQGQDANSINLDRLEFGTTYYWRVDEVNTSADHTIFKGSVWSFTVESYSIMISVDVNNVTASSFNPASPPSMLVNGSGLDGNAHSNDEETMWLSAIPDPDPWLMFEFDTIQKLDQVTIWNANTSAEIAVGWGIKDVNIVTSVDGETWTTLGLPSQISQAPGLDTYSDPHVVDLNLTLAKYVKLDILSNWGGILDQYGVSEVQFYGLPVYARTPDPASDSVILPDAVATWHAGREADEHTISASIDPNALADGTAYSVSSSTNSLDLSLLGLELDQVYYWRVDEVNQSETPSVWQGPQWNLSTVPFLTIDDFESYTNDPNSYSRVFQTWIDGAGYTNPVEVAGNGTGSYMGHNPQLGDIMETGIVHGGAQSSPISFGNNGQSVSEVDRTFDKPQDWTRSSVQTLALYVYGLPGNSGQLYLKINGQRVDYSGLSDVLQRQQWVLWPVDLSTVAVDVDLTNITSLTIGIEGASAPGMIYVDDIRLYPLAPDTIDPVVPSDSDPNLVSLYEFEGNANDSVGDHHATPEGAPMYVQGQIGQAIRFDGFIDYVVHSFEAEEIWPATSVSLWVRTDALTQEINTSLFNNNSSDNDFQFDMDGGDPGFYRYAGTGGNSRLGAASTEWVHLAMSCDGTTTNLYYNGLFVTSLDQANTQYGQIAVGINRGMVKMFEGELDEVRVYNRALSHGEVAGLAGLTESVPAPF